MLNRPVPILFLSLLISVSFFGSVCSQPKSKSLSDNLPASVSLRVGVTHLSGDLSERRIRQAFGASLTVPLNRFLLVDLTADMGALEAWQETFFHSQSRASFIQATLNGAVDWLRLFHLKNQSTSLQTGVGVGLIFFNAQAYDLRTGKLQRLTNNENSHRTRDGIRTRGGPGVRRTHELAVPLSLRGATALSRQIDVFGEIRYTFTRTDKLDATLDGNNGVMLPGTSAFTEGNHFDQNSQDRWLFLAVGLSYYFGKRKGLKD